MRGDASEAASTPSWLSAAPVAAVVGTCSASTSASATHASSDFTAGLRSNPGTVSVRTSGLCPSLALKGEHALLEPFVHGQGVPDRSQSMQPADGGG